MILKDIEVQKEKVIIITEEQILESLGLDKFKWKLFEAHDDFPAKRVIIKIVQREGYYQDYPNNFKE